MFGYTLVKKARLEELERAETVSNGLYHYYHWFSGWPHVHKLLGKFVQGEIWTGSVWNARHEFAEAMGTDDWGRAKAALEGGE